jgi:hypothetical protein
MPDSSTFPTECVRCGQRLLLLAAGREVCERCHLGHPSGEVVVETRKAKPLAIPVACSGCGREVLDDGVTPVPVADGYCLSCRLDGVHLASSGAQAVAAAA